MCDSPVIEMQLLSMQPMHPALGPQMFIVPVNTQDLLMFNNTVEEEGKINFALHIKYGSS